MKPIELLAPAGNPECLDAALGEGADAVYLGLKTFNARLRGTNFAYSQFEAALRAVHRQQRKLYVALNTVFEQRESDRVYQTLKYLAQTGPDAIIVQDMGIAQMAASCFPGLPLHASTQMNISSAAGCNLLAKYGVRRAVLARELAAAEIQALREHTALELEVFVHGALCVSVSGLCLFSSFLGGKSANRGMCTQACRRLYSSGSEMSGYYFSPKDLQLLDGVKTLASAGIDALKIEGRMKSADYTGAATAAYRLVLDALGASDEAYGKALAQSAAILQGDFARAKTSYLFSGENKAADWLDYRQAGGTGLFLGQIHKETGAGEDRRVCLAAAAADAIPEAGDSIRLHSAADLKRMSHKLTFVRLRGRELWLSAPEGFVPGDNVYLIQKSAAKRYAPVLPRDLSPYKRQPGFDHAPAPPSLPYAPGGSARQPRKETSVAVLKEGFYAAVSAVEDLYIVQAERPAAVILPFSKKTAALLAGPEAARLPFKAGGIILTLDPVVTEEADQTLREALGPLMEKGYTAYIANNPAQLQVLGAYAERARSAGKTAPLIVAGPYLYTFNRYAAAFMAGFGAAYFVTPLENSRQNLEKTFGAAERRRVFVTVFSHPPLFRVRANLGALYSFKQFSDGKDGLFRLRSVSGDPAGSGSIVVPETPFALTSKIRFMREAGFRRFILDFSGKPFKKPLYKDVMKRALNSAAIPGASPFNWKDGFYSPPAAGAGTHPLRS